MYLKEDLTEKEIEKFKKSYEVLKEHLKGMSFYDFLDLIIAEEMNNIDNVKLTIDKF